ncbi:MAG: DUF22 domain-containing protein [Candidatus Nezhaarchaeota archaeon]|nr:DUF22 domain-containing protein [Candidatus Nezhaarchaeota archaeon]
MTLRQRVVVKYLSKRSGEVKRLEFPNQMIEYIISTAGRWINIVANESIEVKAGQPVVVKIDPVHLHPKEITLTCPVSRHALGVLLGLYGSEGKPQPIESSRVFDKAIFLALRDGVIEDGDMLGIINAVVVYAVLEKQIIRVNRFESVIC